MTQTTLGDDRTDSSAGSIPAPSDRSNLRAVIETAEDDPRSCTIYPVSATGIDLMSQWITAHGESFVELEAIE
jgi:hypothetical protein